ncbi:MAG: DUF2281 domain-containing protein [Chloroflexi bacterium]|nr:DUF2281 domain-containing protein [Chloroflexota bacterium]
MVRELPPELQQEVADFIEFLLQKRAAKPHGMPSFGWAGALKDLGDQYTSVEVMEHVSWFQ